MLSDRMQPAHWFPQERSPLSLLVSQNPFSEFRRSSYHIYCVKVMTIVMYHVPTEAEKLWWYMNMNPRSGRLEWFLSIVIETKPPVTCNYRSYFGVLFRGCKWVPNVSCLGISTLWIRILIIGDKTPICQIIWKLLIRASLFDISRSIALG